MARRFYQGGLGGGMAPDQSTAPILSRNHLHGQDLVVFFRDGKPGYRFMTAPLKLKRREQNGK